MKPNQKLIWEIFGSNMLSYLSSARKIFFKKWSTPELITFFVTHKCCLKCKHCFFWRELNKDTKELSLIEIKNIAEKMRDFTYLALTGGETYLRDDLPDIVEAFSHKIKYLSINTNGYFTERIVPITENILKKSPDINLVVLVSIDGIGKDHDNIRGVEGSFRKAIQSIDQLKLLKTRYRNLKVGVAITIMSQNQDSIFDTYKYVSTILKPDSVSVTLVRGDTRIPDCKKVNIENYERVCQEIDRDSLSGKISGYRGFFLSDIITAMKMILWKLTSKIYINNRYIIPCYANQLSGVIYANGDIYPCELLDEKIGNIKDFDYDFNQLWFSERAKSITDNIKKTKCFCYHDCNLTYNILFNPYYTLRLMYLALVLNVTRKYNKLLRRK